MRAGGRARRATRPIEIREERESRGEIGPRRSRAFLRQPNCSDHCEGPCGGRRDPHEPSHPERLRAEQRVPPSLDAHRQEVAVDHKAGDHQEQVDTDAEGGQGEAVGNVRLEPIDQPDMREHDHNQGQSAQFVDDANSLARLQLPLDHGDPFGPGSIRVATEAAVGVFALRVTSPVARLSRACLRMSPPRERSAQEAGQCPSPARSSCGDDDSAYQLWA